MSRQTALLMMVPLLLVVMWLGARGLTADPLWYDEWWSVWLSGGGPFGGPIWPNEVWARGARYEPFNTIAYPALLSIWNRLLGSTVYAGRVFSLLWGALAVAMTYRLGRDVHSRAAGVGAALTLGVSGFYVLYLHELRTYTMMIFCVAGAVWSYWQIFNRRAGVGVHLFFGLCVLGLFYTHYYAALVAVTIALYHLLFAPKTRRWWVVVGLMGAAFALYLPWFWVMLGALSRMLGDTRYANVAIGPREAFGDVLTLFSNGQAALLLVLLAVGATVRAPGRRYALAMLLGALTIALAFVGISETLLNVRYLLIVWPLAALVVGLGVARLAESRVPVGLVLGVWLGVGVWTTLINPPQDMEPYWKIGWDHLAEAVEGRTREGDLIAMHLPNNTSRPGHDGVRAYYLDHMPADSRVVVSMNGTSDDAYIAEAETALAGYTRVWHAYDPAQEPHRRPMFEAVLRERFVYCTTVVDNDDLHLDLFSRTDDQCEQRSIAQVEE